MAKIFITYGNQNFKNSLRRIEKEARKLKIFDKIIIYNPKDLPAFIKASPLMAFTRLGGYAVWKSWIIYNTYQMAQEGDIIVYTDAGCRLNRTEEWKTFFELLKPDTTLLFQYRSEVDYQWKTAFGPNAVSRSGNWIKQSVKDYFRPMFKNEMWLNENKVWSGAFMTCKGKTENKLITEWFRITILKPELSMDVFGNEYVFQENAFVEHRHDQALLGILAEYYKASQNIIYLPETSESQHDIAAIVATRLKDMPNEPIGKVIRDLIKKTIGIDNYKKTKALLKP